MMKKITLGCVALLYTGFAAFAQVNLQSGLVAQYPMNNSPLDATSNHLDLSVNGAPVGAMDRFGNINKAYELNSANPDYFTSGFSALLSPAEITLAAWVNLPDALPDQKIAGKASVGAGGYLMGVDSNKIDAEFWDLNGIHFRLKADGVSPTAWNHLAISYKAGNYVKVYINGFVVDSIAAGVSGVGSSSFPFTVGGAPWQPTALNANGTIDDIFLYNREINPAEMLALYSLITSAIDQQASFGATTIYPVPTHAGNISIDFKNNVTGTVLVKITDSLGKEVFQTVFSNPGKEHLNLSSLSTGLYAVSFINGNRIESHRLVIQ